MKYRKSVTISVAFQGEKGAFSFSAGLKLLGPRAELRAYPSFSEVFAAVESGETTYGVVPIENTLHGSVHENYDHLLDYKVTICGETNLPIVHNLIVLPGTRWRDVRRAFSHPVALNQCRRFFERNPQIEPVSHYDTAGSVKMLFAEKPEGAAAIASETAAGIYGGAILRRHIEDNRENFTRFFLLTKQNAAARAGKGEWKTSLVFATPNNPGALFRSMACFALRDLNLTKIESRPLRARPWEYLFYLDIVGAPKEPRVKHALANLAETTSFLKVLGSYRPTA